MKIFVFCHEEIEDAGIVRLFNLFNSGLELFVFLLEFCHGIGCFCAYFGQGEFLPNAEGISALILLVAKDELCQESVHFCLIDSVFALRFDILETSHFHRLVQCIGNTFDEGYLLPAYDAPAFENHSLPAHIDPLMISSFHHRHEQLCLSIPLSALSH